MQIKKKKSRKGIENIKAGRFYSEIRIFLFRCMIDRLRLNKSNANVNIIKRKIDEESACSIFHLLTTQSPLFLSPIDFTKKKTSIFI